MNLWTPNCDQKLQLQLYNCTEKLDTLLIAEKKCKNYIILIKFLLNFFDICFLNALALVFVLVLALTLPGF